nr:hypothetical protein [Tanacetum cinerariifolium]
MNRYGYSSIAEGDLRKVSDIGAPNGDALRKCILNGPYTPTTVAVQAVAATDDSLAIPEHTTVETPLNMSPENKAQYESEKEAIHLILTGIGDEIYSTVDACKIAQEIWEAIERLQQVSTFLFLKFEEVLRLLLVGSLSYSEADLDGGVNGLAISLPLYLVVV